MPLVSCRDMVLAAYRGGYAVAQLNANGGTYDLARAILEAAREARSPIIVGCYEGNAAYGGLRYIGRNLRLMIEEYAPDVPAAIHLDHGTSYAAAAQAIQAGFTSVMVDGSKLPLAENIALTAKVCELAHACDVTCEAELGRLLSGESAPDHPNLARVEDVRALTAQVPVDLLAVAIGNSHGFYKGEPRLNMQRLREIREATEVPLVLHGTTGLSAAQVRDCIALGMAKVNLGTQLRTNYLKYYGEMISSFDHQGHPWRVGREVKNRLKAECRAFLELVGSAGKA